MECDVSERASRIGKLKGISVAPVCGTEHIRLTGHYDFTLQTETESGELRPHRQPEKEG